MASIRVTNTLDDLASDYADAAAQAPARLARTVNKNARDGNRLAARFASATSSPHAKEYAGFFSVDRLSDFSYEYGPRHAGQGELAPILENGSRNNPAHNNLLKSLDVVGPALAHDAGEVLAALFRSR